jgi:hypothetical protein
MQPGISTGLVRERSAFTLLMALLLSATWTWVSWVSGPPIAASNSEAAPRVNFAALGFKTADLTGQVLELPVLKGKVVVVNFLAV